MRLAPHRLAACLLLASCHATGVPTEDDTGPGPSDDSGPPDTAPEGPLADVRVTVHEEVATMLVVTWTQAVDAEATWVEVTADGEAPAATPPLPHGPGTWTRILLGLPADTGVTVTVRATSGGEDLAASPVRARTGALPADLPVPSPVAWDEALASPEPWILGSVEQSTDDWYVGPWWLFVMDREGRVVWYWKVPRQRCTMHGRIALDGTHLLFEETTLYTGDLGADSRIRRMGLDLIYDEEIAVPNLGSTFAETRSGALLFDDYSDWPRTRLTQLDPDGTRTVLWTCNDWMDAYDRDPYTCDPNETVWVEATDTVIWSMWRPDTAVELDRASGSLLRQWGSLPDSWAFDPQDAGFYMQHFPHYTAAGTLLVSTHATDGSGHQWAREYEVDDADGTLRQVWSHDGGRENWATYAGEAQRLANGNTLVNYGTAGAAREVTPEGEIAWAVEWPDTYLLGHFSPVMDLYALAPQTAR